LIPANQERSSATADTVTLVVNGSATTYFYDGANWRRVGLGGANANDTPVPGGRFGADQQEGQRRRLRDVSAHGAV
jgi:hypothetical protein